MKHKQPCYTPRSELEAVIHGNSMYCCAEWNELDSITQAQHKLAHTKQWRDYKEHCEHIKFYQEQDALANIKELDPQRVNSIVDQLKNGK